MRYYDSKKNRLVWINSGSSPEFWDNHWKVNKNEKIFKFPAKHRFLKRTTAKYITKGKKILEGGCGLGDKVFALNNAGYDAYGIDYAEQTVKQIKKNWPNLKIQVGDVRQLPFPDNFFDGYWSFGVIEHFYSGCGEILNEMSRVIKPDGYLFITFPAMTKIRKFKAKKGKYQIFIEKKININNFYQFALDPEFIKKELEKRGFKIILNRGQGSLKGIKEEFPFFAPLISKLTKLPFNLGVVLGSILDKFFGDFVGHVHMLILKKL